MQAVTSTISVSLLLILLGTIVLLSLTARVVADSVKENLTVTVVLDDDAQTIEGEQVQDTLKAKGYISSIEYISREQALQEQVESMGIDPTDLLGANPFPISMEVKVKPEYASSDSLQWISQELRSIKYVADVVYQKDLVESINRNLHRASLFLLAIALLLVVISINLGLVNLLTPMVKATPILSVMTDDLGILHDAEECGCGIHSPYLEILGRVGLKEIRTCAAGAAELLKGGAE